ncbi:MAG: glycosyltransferase [Holophagales bacterium]|nr:glycosyltransferase [Holophagales bacterium]
MFAAPGPAAEARAGRAPQPAAVRGNDWRAVELPDLNTFAPPPPLSVVVPCFDAPEALELTLAGLEGQSYQKDRFEVIVVDDGSSPPLAVPGSTPLDVRLVRREARGFGLAAARNAGARAAAHDILVFLDGDVIAEAGLLAAHARWHQGVADALTQGFCACVSAAGLDPAAIRGRTGWLADLLADRPKDPPWFERHMARTGDLTSRHDDLFRAVTGHNLGIRKAFFEEAGGFDVSFDRYGGEDTEFGYRVWCRGGLLVPVREAFGWHQGRWGADRERKERDQDLQAAKLAGLIPDPGFRRFGRGPVFAVPRHVATIDAGDAPARRLLEVAERLLADPADDLAVRIETPAGRDERRLLRQLAGADPGVTVGPAGTALESFPHSPFHIAIPAGVEPPRRLAPKLRAALGGGVRAELLLPDGSRIVIARTWALHRARRAGGRAEDYGESRTVRAPRYRFGAGRPAAWRAPRARPRRGARAVAARVGAEVRQVRGSAGIGRLLGWLVSALRWRLRELRDGRAER